MTIGLSLVARKLALPGLAIAFAALLAPAPFLEDGTCRGFDGGLSGNDPDAEATLVLCRCGERLYGRLLIEGVSGVSVAELRGELTGSRGIHLEDSRGLVARAEPGWTYCFDDVWDLSWDPFGERLSGTYRSEQCDDSGTLRLAPRR
jgi:hypothetical protein